MPQVITTGDGRNHTIFDERDIISLMETYAGYEVGEWLREWMKCQEELVRNAKSELEKSQEENDRLSDHQRLVLTDMYEEASWLLKLVGEYRPKRSDIRNCAMKIWNVLYQEL